MLERSFIVERRGVTHFHLTGTATALAGTSSTITTNTIGKCKYLAPNFKDDIFGNQKCYTNLDRGVVPGALIEVPQSSSPLDADPLEVTAVSHESPEEAGAAALLLDRDLSPPLFPVVEAQESAAAPQSSSVDFLALGVDLPAPEGGAGIPQSSSFDFLALGDALSPDLGGTEAPQSSSFDLLALDDALPLPRGAALAPVAHGLEVDPLSSLAEAVLDRERLLPLLPPPPLGQSTDMCPSSLHCNKNIKYKIV